MPRWQFKWPVADKSECMDYSDEELASDEEPASDNDGFFSDMSTSSNCAFDSDEEIVLNAAYEEVFVIIIAIIMFLQKLTM